MFKKTPQKGLKVMCGRYGRTTPAAVFAKLIDATSPDDATDTPAYNLPPGQMRLCALRTPRDQTLKMGSAWWGLIPSGARDHKFAPTNARSESAAETQPFVNAFRKRHCLVAADFYYEWAKVEGQSAKQPWVIRPADREPFFMAGLWTQAKGLPDGHELAGRVTFTILTGQPVEAISHIHSRQPLVLSNEAARAWVDAPADTSVDDLHEILSGGLVTDYECWPVSTAVNKPSNDDASLLEKV